MDSQTIRILLNGEAVAITGLRPPPACSPGCAARAASPAPRKAATRATAARAPWWSASSPAPRRRRACYAVNACIRFLPTLDGKAVFTVEYLRAQAGGALHPVQQAMVDCHGSQCGFCTPGFVMSLWDLYNDFVPHAGRRRRTPLPRRAAQRAHRQPVPLHRLPADPRGRRAHVRAPAVALERGRSATPCSRCTARTCSTTATPAGTSSPRAAWRRWPRCARRGRKRPLLAGCTDIGLWVNKQLRELDDILSTSAGSRPCGDLAERRRPAHRRGGVAHGGLRRVSPPGPELAELWERFASPPVRNAGTLGGNIANGSPIGDSMPALIALGARIVLASVRGRRSLALEDFYLDYLKKDLAADEIVEAIELPAPAPAQRDCAAGSWPSASTPTSPRCAPASRSSSARERSTPRASLSAAWRRRPGAPPPPRPRSPAGPGTRPRSPLRSARSRTTSPRSTICARRRLPQPRRRRPAHALLPRDPPRCAARRRADARLRREKISPAADAEEDAMNATKPDSSVTASPPPAVRHPHPHEPRHLHVAGEATYVNDLPDPPVPRMRRSPCQRRPTPASWRWTSPRCSPPPA